MKMKWILTVLALVSTPALALQIVHGKLISHKESATKGATASYYQPQLSTLRNESGTSSSVGIVPMYVKAGERFSIKNDAMLMLYNDSKKTARYIVSYGVCSDHLADSAECVDYNDEIELEAGGYVYDVKQPVLSMKINEPGIYITHAEGYILNFDTNETVFSISYSTLTVS